MFEERDPNEATLLEHLHKKVEEFVKKAFARGTGGEGEEVGELRIYLHSLGADGDDTLCLSCSTKEIFVEDEYALRQSPLPGRPKES